MTMVKSTFDGKWARTGDGKLARLVENSCPLFCGNTCHFSVELSDIEVCGGIDVENDVNGTFVVPYDHIGASSDCHWCDVVMAGSCACLPEGPFFIYSCLKTAVSCEGEDLGILEISVIVEIWQVPGGPPYFVNRYVAMMANKPGGPTCTSRSGSTLFYGRDLGVPLADACDAFTVERYYELSDQCGEADFVWPPISVVLGRGGQAEVTPL